MFKNVKVDAVLHKVDFDELGELAQSVASTSGVADVMRDANAVISRFQLLSVRIEVCAFLHKLLVSVIDIERSALNNCRAHIGSTCLWVGGTQQYLLILRKKKLCIAMGEMNVK